MLRSPGTGPVPAVTVITLQSGDQKSHWARIGVCFWLLWLLDVPTLLSMMPPFESLPATVGPAHLCHSAMASSPQGLPGLLVLASGHLGTCYLGVGGVFGVCYSAHGSSTACLRHFGGAGSPPTCQALGRWAGKERVQLEPDPPSFALSPASLSQKPIFQLPELRHRAWGRAMALEAGLLQLSVIMVKRYKNVDFVT